MNLPITRAAAIAAGATKYFTGKPCRNDHIAARYTQSGTCQDCIADVSKVSRKQSDAPARANATPIQQKEFARHQVKTELIALKVRAYPRDVPTLRSLLVTLTRLRWPFIEPEDVVGVGHGSDGSGGTLLYKWRAHPEDCGALHAVAQQLISQNGIDIAAERDRIFGQVQRELEEAVEEPEWRP